MRGKWNVGEREAALIAQSRGLRNWLEDSVASPQRHGECLFSNKCGNSL